MRHIKLFESFGKDEILDEYIEEIRKGNSLIVSPVNSSELILNNYAIIELDRFDKHQRREINLKDISVFDKKKGFGTKAMDILTKAADAIGVDLTLHAKPFGLNTMGKRELVKFYKKYGFKTVPGQFDVDDENEIEEYVFSEESEGLDMFREHR